MTVLLVAATPPEIAPTVEWLRTTAVRHDRNVLGFPRCSVEVLFTGIGPTATAYALGQRLAAGEVTLAIQAGIGGAIDPALDMGGVYRIVTDRFGDVGAEDRSGGFLGLDEIGLPPGPPFDAAGRLIAPAAELPFPVAEGITLGRASGSAATIARLRTHFPDAQIESMEGAAFFYACGQADVPPLQLRAISNYVVPRDRDQWRMGEAIAALNGALRRVLGPFTTTA